MKIGVCEKDLRGSLAQTLDWMQANGLEGFQIWKRKTDQEGLSSQEVKAMADDRNLVVTSVGGGPNMVVPEKAGETIDLFKGFLDFSVELGSGIVCAESKHRPEDLPEEDAWKSTVSTVRTICDHAESIGGTLAIEAAGPCFIRDHDMFLELKRRVGSDALKVNYDPANIVWAGRDVVEGAKALAGDIVHTHAKDIARVVDDAQDTDEERLMDVPAGQGLVGYDTYIPALREIGYDGFLVIEMHAGEQDRRDHILAAKTALEALLNGKGGA